MKSTTARMLSYLAVSIGTMGAAGSAGGTDGVLEINQASALAGSVTPGDAAGFPVEIFTRGSFRLTSDLVVPAGAPAGINVYAAGSRIDLNGFTISSTTQCPGSPPVCAPTGTGIGIDASGASDVSIRNGRISGFGVYGVFLSEGSRAENLSVEQNGSAGIVVEEGCVVADNIVRRNGGFGIQAGPASRITSNAVMRNGGLGISAPVSAVSVGNAVSDNVGSGSAGSRYRRFYLTRNFVSGSGALAACASGFHMASLWELLDPSSLVYDTTLGVLVGDSGKGPPSASSGGADVGWMRTGFPTLPNANCSAWTSNSAGQFGNRFYLNMIGATSVPPEASNTAAPWSPSPASCDKLHSVWCVED